MQLHSYAMLWYSRDASTPLVSIFPHTHVRRVIHMWRIQTGHSARKRVNAVISEGTKHGIVSQLIVFRLTVL